MEAWLQPCDRAARGPEGGGAAAWTWLLPCDRAARRPEGGGWALPHDPKSTALSDCTPVEQLAGCLVEPAAEVARSRWAVLIGPLPITCVLVGGAG